MHACGHDAQITASLLWGRKRFLNELRTKFEGTPIKLIFKPGRRKWRLAELSFMIKNVF